MKTLSYFTLTAGGGRSFSMMQINISNSEAKKKEAMRAQNSTPDAEYTNWHKVLIVYQSLLPFLLVHCVTIPQLTSCLRQLMNMQLLWLRAIKLRAPQEQDILYRNAQQRH